MCEGEDALMCPGSHFSMTQMQQWCLIAVGPSNVSKCRLCQLFLRSRLPLPCYISVQYSDDFLKKTLLLDFAVWTTCDSVSMLQQKAPASDKNRTLFLAYDTFLGTCRSVPRNRTVTGHIPSPRQEHGARVALSIHVFT